MNFEICNPKEDQYGNSKENIFLAFGLEGNYLGSAYAYPTINYHQTYETPYIIFIDVNVENNEDKRFSEEIMQELFEKVLMRAKELRSQKPELTARIYSGFEQNKDKFDFYIKNGFEEDFSLIMEADLPENFSFTLPNNVSIVDCETELDEDFNKYKLIYDEIFVTPLNRETLIEQGKEKNFKHLSFFIDDKQQGGAIIFEKDGLGYIEALYVLPEVRGKGLSKIMMNYLFDYFISKGLMKTQLEVWELNKRAVKLYESFEFKEVRKNLMFPGITIEA